MYIISTFQEEAKKNKKYAGAVRASVNLFSNTPVVTKKHVKH